MNAALRRLLLPILRTVRSGKAPSFRNRSAAEQAIFLLGKPASQRRKKAAAARKSAKAVQHRDKDLALRAAVEHRAGGLCELHTTSYSWHGGVEPHHLEGGSARRALQWVGNTMWTCRDGHDAFHRRPEDFREIVIAWCDQHGYPTPRRFRDAKMTSAASAAKPPPKALSGDES